MVGTDHDDETINKNDFFFNIFFFSIRAKNRSKSSGSRRERDRARGDQKVFFPVFFFCFFFVFAFFFCFLVGNNGGISRRRRGRDGCVQSPADQVNCANPTGVPHPHPTPFLSLFFSLYFYFDFDFIFWTLDFAAGLRNATCFDAGLLFRIFFSFFFLFFFGKGGPWKEKENLGVDPLFFSVFFLLDFSFELGKSFFLRHFELICSDFFFLFLFLYR